MIVLIYFFKLTICSTLFYSYYRIFLQNRQFHVYNRFYLLGAVILSLVLPLLNISLQNLLGSQNFHQGGFLSFFNNWEQAITITPNRIHSYSNISWQNLGYIIYFSLIVFFLIGLSKSLWYIRKISRLYPSTQIGRIRLFETNESDAPFSFFNLVFWNRELDIESSEGQQVFRHECYHVHEKHSIDILFFEIITALFWFNPIFHLIKKEIKAIHEFLADRNVVSANNRYDYAELLVLRSFNAKYPQLINPFFHNQIKRRIVMITKLQNPRHNYLSRIMMIPLLFILFFAFACTRDQATKESTEKIYSKVEVESDFPGGPEAWRNFIYKTLHYPDDAINKEIQGDVLVQFVIDKKGNVSDVKAISGPKELRAESVRVIEQSSGKWIPAMEGGQKVAAYKLQPIKYRLEAQ
ncbi:MAG TPA: M56 family metallopeptidase [Puia sp.]|nr:M56 family metallopeptidase [Puia sp.]